MAVIQISKIQIRRGLATAEGLPQLASGEMGWALDQQRLFIGNGSVAEGAPAVGNTEVLTEARMFELLSDTRFTATNYTYMGHFTATNIQTGADANSPIVRTLQEKLDDHVNALDFGVEERTDITQSLQRALDQIFDNDTDWDLSRSKVPVRIPAGEYYLTGTVYVPPYATIVGDGIDKTILVSINTGSSTTIFETKDSNGDTGLDINSAVQPRHVSISEMTLSYGTQTNIDVASPLMVLTTIEDSAITDMKFTGQYVKGDTTTSTYTAIKLAGNLTNSLTIDNIEVTGVCYPIIANDDMYDVEIKNSKFNLLYQGITLANDLLGTLPSLHGPKDILIENNKFDYIEKQAVYAGPNSRDNNQINLRKNSYKNVGNDLDSDNNPVTSIVSLLSHGNSTIDDNFERLWNAQKAYTDVAQKPAVEGTVKIEISSTDRRVIEESTTTQTLIRIPYANTVTSVTVDYTLEKASMYRKGTLNIVAFDSVTSCRDSYNVAGLTDGDTAFSAELVDTESLGNIDTLAVKYDNPVSSGTGTVVFNISYYK